MDTLPARHYRNGKRIDGSYPCMQCPYGDNKTCSMCVFARWNVEGIQAGFSPKEAYRQAHKQDVSQSPLMQKLEKPQPIDHGLPNNNVLPKVNLPFFPVPSYNSMQQSLDKLAQVRRRL